jgi:hypothetical protein
MTKAPLASNSDGGINLCPRILDKIVFSAAPIL